MCLYLLACPFILVCGKGRGGLLGLEGGDKGASSTKQWLAPLPSRKAPPSLPRSGTNTLASFTSLLFLPFALLHFLTPWYSFLFVGFSLSSFVFIINFLATWRLLLLVRIYDFWIFGLCILFVLHFLSSGSLLFSWLIFLCNCKYFCIVASLTPSFLTLHITNLFIFVILISKHLLLFFLGWDLPRVTFSSFLLYFPLPPLAPPLLLFVSLAVSPSSSSSFSSRPFFFLLLHVSLYLLISLFQSLLYILFLPLWLLFFHPLALYFLSCHLVCGLGFHLLFSLSFLLYHSAHFLLHYLFAHSLLFILSASMFFSYFIHFSPLLYFTFFFTILPFHCYTVFLPHVFKPSTKFNLFRSYKPTPVDQLKCNFYLYCKLSLLWSAVKSSREILCWDHQDLNFHYLIIVSLKILEAIILLNWNFFKLGVLYVLKICI